MEYTWSCLLLCRIMVKRYLRNVIDLGGNPSGQGDWLFSIWLRAFFFFFFKFIRNQWRIDSMLIILGVVKLLHPQCFVWPYQAFLFCIATWFFFVFFAYWFSDYCSVCDLLSADRSALSLILTLIWICPLMLFACLIIIKVLNHTCIHSCLRKRLDLFSLFKKSVTG